MSLISCLNSSSKGSFQFLHVIGDCRLWDVRTGKIIQTLETKSPVTSAEVSQDGRYITTADGTTVKFWDANQYVSNWVFSNCWFLQAWKITLSITCNISYGLVKSYNMPCNMESASLEPKFGNKFIAGGEDMWIHVFDFNTGEEIGRFLHLVGIREN